MVKYNFSKNLRKIRKEKGLSQDELAKGLGVSQITISAWERNERYPPIDKVYDVAGYLEIPIETLL